MDKEIWLPVVGHEKTHEVSSHGKLRSLDRFVRSPSSSKTYHCKGKLLNVKTRSRYKNINLAWCKSDTVHRIVAKAFVPNPDGFTHVHHIDGNHKNNAASNLQWVSPSDHARHHRIKGNPSGAVTSRKSQVQDIAIRLLIEGKIQVNEAALICDVSRQTISTWLKNRISSIT